MLIGALRKDVEFLRNQGLMDYSLLLCVEKIPKPIEKENEMAKSIQKIKVNLSSK